MREMELCRTLSKFGIKPGLERIAKLMDTLRHPERQMKVILVTGTNGKGSVTSFLASILKEAGYKTGSYFSPHLVNYNERFKINGKSISDAKLRKYEKKILSLLERGFEATEFEALTAIAYKYFSDENCDFAVMEIGMGGRLDATNIAEECISIITNVDLEHTDYLGGTIEQVAFEKAGIMKKGIAITGAHGKALGTIKDESENKNISLHVLNEDVFAKTVSATDKKNVFNYVGYEFFNSIETLLIGRHQASNAALAIAAAEELGIEEDAIRDGIKKTKNPGRLEQISVNPLVVIDGAHNPHGIRELIGNLDLFRYDKLAIVFGVMKDKDWKEMIRLLAPHCDLFVATQPKMERAEAAKKISKEAAIYTDSIAEKNPKKAVSLAKKQCGKNGMVLICGSLYLIGEIKNYISK
ncbi:TPA: bifunctional folylpolyglutamate synthase/dihydrofolate synthase [Candidatus Micrarchaeota archaeon]|nr:bifunctional folylpolyglutamate synthase/dihydrofolate synthase [Candidatus Micrarchaeota archaeon]